MTIQEIYELIKQKKESAVNDLRHKMAQVSKLCAELTYDELQQCAEYDNLKDKENKLIGEIDAYTDVLCLIESSGVLDDK